jgi:hypothetical protein
MQLIGVCGPASSGKDTLSDYIVTQYGGCKYAFADPLKKAAKILFNLTYDQLHGSKKEEIDERWNLSPRQILQRLGTEGCRDIFSDTIFITRMLQDFESYRHLQDGYFVVSDVRFENERNAIRDNGGTVIHIYRENITPANAHVTEQRLVPSDDEFVISNNGSINDMIEAVSKIIAKF